MIFLPSGKESEVRSIEGFNVPAKNQISSPYSTGLTLSTQIYVKQGELMYRKDESPAQISTRLKVNIFWMGRSPMICGKRYKLKLGSARESVELVDVLNVIDASELTTIQGKKQLDRHDVGECVIETSKPVAFDPVSEIENTGRFVIVDNYDIAGGGIIVSKDDDSKSLISSHISQREYSWEKGLVNECDRASRNNHKSKFIIITGPEGGEKRIIAKKLEHQLFMLRLNVYYLGVGSISGGLESDMTVVMDKDEHVRRIGELARIMTDAGMIFITVIDDLDDYDIQKLRLLNSPNEVFVVHIGKDKSIALKSDLELSADGALDESLNSVMNLLYKTYVIY